MSRFIHSYSIHEFTRKLHRPGAWFIITLLFVYMFTGCGNNPAPVARFYVESILKDNEKNARECIVASKRDEIEISEQVFIPPILGMEDADPLSPEIMKIRRMMAKNLVFKVVEHKEDSAIVKYGYDLDGLREELANTVAGSKTFFEQTIVESFLAYLDGFEETLNLVMENREWKIDPPV